MRPDSRQPLQHVPGRGQQGRVRRVPVFTQADIGADNGMFVAGLQGRLDQRVSICGYGGRLGSRVRLTIDGVQGAAELPSIPNQQDGACLTQVGHKLPRGPGNDYTVEKRDQSLGMESR